MRRQSLNQRITCAWNAWRRQDILVEGVCVLYFRPESALMRASGTDMCGNPRLRADRSRAIACSRNRFMNLQNDPQSLALMKFGIGQPVPRTEDPTLVRGHGCYTDDIKLPREAYAVMVRSRHAHGVIKGIDISAAKSMPGVLGVYTGADLHGLRPAQMHRAVQESRRLADAQAAAAGARRPTRCASSAIRSPAWWRKPCCRRKTRPRRSSSTSSRCPPSPGRTRRCARRAAAL